MFTVQHSPAWVLCKFYGELFLLLSSSSTISEDDVGVDGSSDGKLEKMAKF
jgi:hypothetical protein